MDPLADTYYSYSPYNYALNDPIGKLDPNGMWVQRPHGYFIDKPEDIQKFLEESRALHEDEQEDPPKKNKLSKEEIERLNQESVEWQRGVLTGFNEVLLWGRSFFAGFGGEKQLKAVKGVGTMWVSYAQRTSGTAQAGVGVENSVLTVTSEGVVLPRGAKIPNSFVENPYRHGSYGVMENGKFIEKLRIDPATPINKKGPGVSHFHLDGEKEHIFNISRWPWWQN